MRSLGIDIGRHSIKVVEILASNRTYEILNAKEYKILNMETSDQEIDILQTLDRISKEFDTDNAKVTVSIRQQYVSTRKLFFPFKERAKIHKSLAFELEDDIPLSIEKAIYDSKIIKFHEKSAEVVAMACVSEEIEKTIDIFERGHIDPDIVTPEFCAISNLYEKWYKAPEEIPVDSENPDAGDKLIVHIGHTKTFVGVVSKGYLVWGRSVMWGAEKVAAAISQSFQVPFTTAHEMMPTKAFLLLTAQGANKDQLKMSDAIAKSLEQLVQSLRLTMMLANTEYGVNVESIELIGGPSHIKNMAAYLTQELERPCNTANPLKGLSDKHIRNANRLSEAHQMALGLAIEGLRRPFNPSVNFRQNDFAKKNVSFEKFWEKWNYTAKVIAAGYVAFLIYGISMDSLAIQLEDASCDVLVNQASKVAKIKTTCGKQRTLRKFIKDNKENARKVKLFEQVSEINSPMKFINEVAQALPSNKKDKSYDVRRFVVSESNIDIEGVADTDQTVKRLKKALTAVAANSKVKDITPKIPREGSKKVFAFEFTVKRKN